MKSTKFTSKINRNKHQLDATGQSAGRIASLSAVLLQGKNKADYSPQADKGDFVEISNSAKLQFTGKKLEQKKYYTYSGYPGGLKTKKIKEIFKNDPQEIIRKAVYNMLPKNKLRKDMIKRLTFK